MSIADTPKSQRRFSATFCRLLSDSQGLVRGPALRFRCQSAHIVSIVFHVAHGGLLDTIEHPNQRRYAGQRIFIVKVEEYVCLVPFVEDDAVIFLKTIVPSRKMTKQYLGGDAE